MSNVSLRKSYVADVAIAPFTIVKLGSSTNNVTPCTGVADVPVGIVGEVGPAAGERVDVSMSGIDYVTLGGTVTANGASPWLTSNASGAAVAAAPAAGVNNAVVGLALESGVAGDVIRCLINPFRIQG